MGGTGSNHAQQIQMLNSTNRNWQIASGWASANDLDFTPSTSGGGTTFSNYVLRLEGDTGNAIFSGALSKGSGSFRIAHPLPELNETHNLVHSFIEGPQADLIYRGKVKLVKGKAEINIDESSDMTEGTFEVLCGDVQCFTTNETDWCPIKGSVKGNILKIVAKDKDCKDTISWMVIGERKDQHILETDWTDDEGHVIVEPLKPVEAEDEPVVGLEA